MILPTQNALHLAISSAVLLDDAKNDTFFVTANQTDAAIGSARVFYYSHNCRSYEQDDCRFFICFDDQGAEHHLKSTLVHCFSADNDLIIDDKASSMRLNLVKIGWSDDLLLTIRGKIEWAQNQPYGFRDLVTQPWGPIQQRLTALYATAINKTIDEFTAELTKEKPHQKAWDIIDSYGLTIESALRDWYVDRVIAGDLRIIEIAKAATSVASANGSTISWGLFESPLTGEYLGKIQQNGRLIGCIDIDDNGAALVYVGNTNQHIKADSTEIYVDSDKLALATLKAIEAVGVSLR